MTTYWKISAVAVLLTATALPALAQSEPSEAVTVFAPYIVKKVQTSPGLGKRLPVSTVSVSRSVSYQDIDLTTDTGETMLVGRIRQAADDVCRQLERRFPKAVYIPVSEDKDCAKNAEAEAMMQVHAVVAASRAGM